MFFLSKRPTSFDSPTSLSSTSKVTLNDVYETLRKLEEVERFPVQPMLQNDSGIFYILKFKLRTNNSCFHLAYLTDPTGVSTVDDEIPPLPPQAPSRVDSILSYLDEANRNEVSIESVRSQKTTNRETSAPSTVRFTTPPPSNRSQPPPHHQQQQPKKLAQSVAVSQNRASPSVDQQAKQGNKVTTPHKSLQVAVQPAKLTDEDFEDDEAEATRTAQDVTETVLQLRMDNEEKQRQLIIFQQRLVNKMIKENQ